jgi:uncharacterized protein (TIGR03435 family)
MARTALAQNTPNIAGTWQGTLQVEGGHRIVVKISKIVAAGPEKSGWKAVYYNFDSHADDLGKLATSITLEGQNLYFAVGSIEGSFTGKLSANGTAITGSWTQSKNSHPLNLFPANDETAWVIPGTGGNMAADADPGLEVATVKPSDPTETWHGMGTRGRHIYAQTITLSQLICAVYGVSAKQLAGGPEWLGSDRYDIDGLPDVLGDPNLKQLDEMFQKLLSDRFKLMFHREKKELSVYAIVVGKNGTKLTKSLGDPNGVGDSTGDDRSGGIDAIRFTNASMGELAGVLQSEMSVPVVDHTGLAGRYDFFLRWTYDESRASDLNAPPRVFAAIEEQLGLKLESVKAPADVIVIDRVERPSEN